MMMAILRIPPEGNTAVVTQVCCDGCDWLHVCVVTAPHGAGHPLSPFLPLVHLLPHLLLLFTFPCLIHFTYFLLLCIPSLSSRIVLLKGVVERERVRTPFL